MKAIDKNKLRRILLISVWILAGLSCLTLLVAAVNKTEHRQCTGINITISGVNNHFFIDKDDVQEIISRNTGNTFAGKAIPNFDLRSIETILKKQVWINNAELYFDNNGVLQAAIEEREPVARIFTTSGTTYYIDSSLAMLPLSEKFSARIPVITGFPADTKVLSRKDSALLRSVRNISMAIHDDPFLMAMIDQVDITPERNFEMLPKIGNQVIVFGDSAFIEKKFDKLKLFYKNIMVKSGWGRYSHVNLQFENQVVARIRGKEDVIADSLRTKALMQMIAEAAEKMAADSIRTFLEDSEKNTDSTIVMHSIQRDDAPDNTPSENAAVKILNDKPAAPKVLIKPAPKTQVKPPVNKPPAVKPPVNKKPTNTVTNKKTTNTNTPKAVMPPKTNNKP